MTVRERAHTRAPAHLNEKQPFICVIHSTGDDPAQNSGEGLLSEGH